MGSPDFAVPSLDKLFQSSHQVVAVVSNPDKRRGRRKAPEPTAIKRRALDLQLPVIDAVDLHNEALAKQLQELKAEHFVVVAFRILPDSLLKIQSIGAGNLHGYLLKLRCA